MTQRFEFSLPPSLHRRDLRQHFADQLKLEVGRRKVPPRMYSVSVFFYGPHFYDKHGDPDPAGPDATNLYKVLADEFARAMEWPGGNDVWIERDAHLTCVQSEKSYVEMQLT